MTPTELSMLTEAQELQSKGVSKETILQRTGMYQGAEGKWRTEIGSAVFTSEAQSLLKDDIMLPMIFQDLGVKGPKQKTTPALVTTTLDKFLQGPIFKRYPR